MSNELDYLGQFLMRHLRDVGLESIDGLCESRFDSPGHREYQEQISTFSEEQKAILKKTVSYCLDGAINDFLYHLDKEIKENDQIQLIVQGKDCSTSTKSLNQKLYGDEGWRERFSGFKSTTE